MALPPYNLTRYGTAFNPRWTATALILAVTMVCLYMFACGEQTGPRKADGTRNDDKLSIIHYELGEIEKDQTYHRTITVTNNFTDVFAISKITKSCGCTSASTEVTQLNPGESFDLDVAVEVKTIEDDWSKDIWIHEQSDAGRVLQIKMTGHFPKDGRLYGMPDEILFGKVRAGSIAEQVARIRRWDGSSVNILNTRTSNNALAVSEITDLFENNGAALLFRLDTTSMDVGPFDGTIFVTTDRPDHKEITFQISGEIINSVYTEPRILLLDSAASADKVWGVDVKGPEHSRINIVDVEHNLDADWALTYKDSHLQLSNEGYTSRPGVIHSDMTLTIDIVPSVGPPRTEKLNLRIIGRLNSP